MKPARPPTSTEQRRTLLKGMLSASSVIGLGYSGSASALTSLTRCIQNQTLTESVQFAYGASPPPHTTSTSAWRKVIVHAYTGTGINTAIAGFQLPDGSVYMAESPWSVIALPNQQADGDGYPKTAWVIVYFDGSTRQEIGAFPHYNAPTPAGNAAYAQASLSCLNSLNPGIVGDYTFGG